MNELRPSADPQHRWWQAAFDGHGTFLRLALGNGTQWRVGLFHFSEGRLKHIFVAIEGVGAYSFCDVVFPSYVQDKLGIRGACDAANFTDFINWQFEGPCVEQFGTYYAEFCHS